jgi:hypothetical protein
MTPQPEFFNAAAQLIPLLVVAAAVDTRMWANAEFQKHNDAVFEVVTLAMVTFAWMASMFVIATGYNSAAAGFIVAIGLAVGWIQIVGSIAVTQTERLRHAKVTRRLRAWIFLVVMSPLGGVLLLWGLSA